MPGTDSFYTALPQGFFLELLSARKVWGEHLRDSEEAECTMRCKNQSDTERNLCETFMPSLSHLRVHDQKEKRSAC